jgi:hypothetical protein
MLVAAVEPALMFGFFRFGATALVRPSRVGDEYQCHIALKVICRSDIGKDDAGQRL